MNRIGKSIYLRPPVESDLEAWCNLLLANRSFFSSFEPRRPDNYYTREVQLNKLTASQEAREKGNEYWFGIFRHEDDELIGDITLYNVREAPFQSATVGYAIDRTQNGNGYATQALHLVVRFAFEELGLRRVVAGVMPRNAASMRVLEKNGFRQEGLHREHVEINGIYEDHLFYGLLRSEWTPLL